MSLNLTIQLIGMRQTLLKLSMVLKLKINLETVCPPLLNDFDRDISTKTFKNIYLKSWCGWGIRFSLSS